MARDKYCIETPQTHAHYRFEMRIFDCPDGVTRLVLFPIGLWQHFDRIMMQGNIDQAELIASMTQYSLNNDETYNHNFSDFLHYWLTLTIKKERARKDGRELLLSLPFNRYA